MAIVTPTVEQAEETLAECRRQLLLALDARDLAMTQWDEAHVAVLKATVEARGESWGDPLPPERPTSRGRLFKRQWDERTERMERNPSGRIPAPTVDDATAALERAWAWVDDLQRERGVVDHRLDDAYLEVMLATDALKDARDQEFYDRLVAESPGKTIVRGQGPSPLPELP